jgi:hypothetical protein
MIALRSHPGAQGFHFRAAFTFDRPPHPRRRNEHQEQDMAKGQKRSNKEIKKPKKAKAPAAAPALPARNLAPAVGNMKKRPSPKA